VAYGIPGVTVDGQDVLAVFDAVSTAVARARAGEGPSLVETVTYRFENHSIGMRSEGYRDPAEVDDWKANRDPILLFRTVLADRGFEAAELAKIDDEVAAEVTAAVEFARSSEPPPPDAAFTHLFTNPIPIVR
jgi:pyruvate dehydrogenase E1 component alpha subunit